MQQQANSLEPAHDSDQDVARSQRRQQLQRPSHQLGPPVLAAGGPLRVGVPPGAGLLRQERCGTEPEQRCLLAMVAGVAQDLDVAGHAEATVRLHKARIKALEQELADCQTKLKQRSTAVTAAQREATDLQKERAGWQKTQKNLQSQVDKWRKAAEDAQRRLDVKENIMVELSRDGSKLDKERRQSEAEAKAREVRLTRALEEIERYKALVQEQRTADRDVKDGAKAEHARLLTGPPAEALPLKGGAEHAQAQAENKRLERQKSELMVAFKKQLKLIDVLKRQKIHLEAARLLKFSEEEFEKAISMEGT
eukprot:jgi/Astpho2/2913/fgenesh1_pg.00050_%23_155_t